MTIIPEVIAITPKKFIESFAVLIVASKQKVIINAMNVILVFRLIILFLILSTDE